MLPADRGYMPAIRLRAYRRPDFIENCATTDHITAIQRKLFFVRVGIWMFLVASLICDRGVLRYPRSVIDV
jgi:hypothetical protein